MTATRRTRKPQERHAHLNAQVGALFLTIDREEFAYWLDTLPHDLGQQIRCYRLTKFAANRKPGEPDAYDVVIHPGQPAGCSCECKGYLRWRRCKHVASLLALHAAGRLS